MLRSLLTISFLPVLVMTVATAAKDASVLLFANDNYKLSQNFLASCTLADQLRKTYGKNIQVVLGGDILSSAMHARLTGGFKAAICFIHCAKESMKKLCIIRFRT